MAYLVVGQRSFLYPHIELYAQAHGLSVSGVDPLEYAEEISSEDDSIVVLFDEEPAQPVESPVAAPEIPEDWPEDEVIPNPVSPDIVRPVLGGQSSDEAQQRRVIEAMIQAQKAEKSILTSIIYLADTRIWVPNPPEGTPQEELTDEQRAQAIRANTVAVVKILENLPQAPSQLVLASSVSAGQSTPVGQALAEAAIILQDATQDTTTRLIELQFPFLFGEGCPPHPSAFIARLAHASAAGRRPRVAQDKTITAMYAQEAARVLLSSTPDFALPTARVTKESAAEVAQLMNEAAEAATTGVFSVGFFLGDRAFASDLYATFLDARLQTMDEGASLPQLASPYIVHDLPGVSARLHRVSAQEPCEVRGVLQGIHRIVILSGAAELRIGDRSLTAVAPEEGTDLPFIDLPHGIPVTLSAVQPEQEESAAQPPCLVAEWVSHHD